MSSDYRTESHHVWEQMAAGWERDQAWVWNASREIGEWLVARLAPQPGQTILELACGTGETGFAAAAQLGDQGKLISTDFSAQMVEAARRRAAELGLRNCEFRVMDAERMDLADDSVDGVLCRWGYMLMADPAAAFAETRRVLRDGGRLALSVWGDPQRNVWGSASRAALAQHGHMPRPVPGQPGIFALADPDRLREFVTGAGFADPEVEEVAAEYSFDTFDDYWRFLEELAGAVALVLKKLSAEQRAAVRATLEQSVRPFRNGDGGYFFPGIALNAVTT